MQHREECVFGIVGHDRCIRFHLGKAVVIHDQGATHGIGPDRNVDTEEFAGRRRRIDRVRNGNGIWEVGAVETSLLEGIRLESRLDIHAEVGQFAL